MAKYIFKVFSPEDGKQTLQVITNAEMMLETLSALSQLGIVKGFILDDDNKEIENDN